MMVYTICVIIQYIYIHIVLSESISWNCHNTSMVIIIVNDEPTTWSRLVVLDLPRESWSPASRCHLDSFGENGGNPMGFRENLR